MNVFPLAIPLTALLNLTNLCAAAFAVGPRFFLNTGADFSPLFARGFRLRLVVFAHGSGFPFTDAASHELWTVGFPKIHPIHEKIQHTYVAPVVIHLELAASEPREQAGTHVPTTLKREPVSLR